jgi:diguanylate cyclase (GGDEF)-like protein/PAS domain S-box-containing protein
MHGLFARKRPPLWLWGGILAAIVTLIVFGFIRRYEENHVETDFRTSAVERFDRLQGNIELALDDLVSLGVYYDVSTDIDGELFRRLTRPLLSERSSLQALEWIPRVADADRARFVQAARRAGLAGYDITERLGQGGLASAGRRPEYYPVYLVEPHRGNEHALGFDLASNPARHAALERAAATGKMSASGRINLVQAPSEYGFLVFRPVYRDDAAHKGTGRLVGFVLGVFRIADIVEAGDKAANSHIQLALFDSAGEKGRRLLYPRRLDVDGIDALPAGYKLVRQVEVAGREWTVVAMPKPGAFLVDHKASASELIFGLLASVLWAAYLRQQRLRHSVIERTVEERTRELDQERIFSNAVFDSAGGVTVVIDRTGAVVRFNRAAETFTGYDFDEVRDQPFFWRRFLLPEQQDGVQTVFERFHDGSLPRRYENYWVSRNGEQRLFDWSNTILTDEHGIPQYLVTVGLDITERKQAERAIERERIRLETILKTASDGIHILDLEGVLVEANNAFLAMLGYDDSAIGKLHVTDWDVQFPWEGINAHVGTLIAEQGHAVFETRHRRRDGVVLDVEISASGIEIEGRGYLYAASRDITERKRIEEALRLSELRFRQLFENNNASMMLVEPETGAIVDANAAACRFYGWPRETMCGMTIQDINCLSPDAVAAELRRAVQEQRNYFVFPHRLADGGVRTVEVHSSPIRVGDRDMLFSIIHDISDRKAAEARVDQLLHEQRVMLDNTIVGMVKVRNRIIVWANRAFEHMLAYDPGELNGVSPLQLYPSREDFDAMGRRAYPIVQSGGFFRGEAQYRCKDGRVIWADISSAVLDQEKGETLWAFFDITERKRTELALSESEAKFHTMVDWTYDWEYWIDPDGHFTYNTPSSERVTGYRPDEFEADPALIDALVHAEDRHLWERHIHIHLPESGNKEVAELEMRIVQKHGDVRWVNHTCRPVFDETGHYRGRRVAVRDITDRKRAEDEIRHLAYFDPLTRLPNRRLLMDRLGQALIASKRSREFGALMILDLDHFKSLNDTQGHDIGDRLLIEVAQRLTASVRQEDTVSRLGGDEYVVMLEGLGRSERTAATQAEAVADKIRLALNLPYVLGGSEAEYYSTPSIGLTLFRGQDDSAEILLKQADVALYQAKDAGRNTVRFFNPTMQAAIDSRAALEGALRRGLDRGEFRLYFQPQVGSDNRLIGAEALIRWLPPSQGVVSPAHFIPLAEESSLILAIGQWVLDTACAQLRLWGNDPETRGLQLSVNVSARQFHQPDFVEQVRQSLLASGADPARLKLELTESVVLDNVEAVISRMQQLDSLGVGFSLDDFGTGYSSLSYLKRLPLDQVKIDQSFVREVTRDPNDAAIVRAILAMSRSLGLEVIAEGVETQEQRDFLLANGCTAYQGYLFGRPVPIEEWNRTAHLSPRMGGTEGEGKPRSS